MLVSTIPDFLRHWAGVVKIHTHTLFLRTLTSEHIRSHRLLDFSLAEQDLLLILAVNLGGLNLDNLATRDQTDMLQLDLDSVVWEYHANERSMEAAHTADIVLGGPGLD